MSKRRWLTLIIAGIVALVLVTGVVTAVSLSTPDPPMSISAPTSSSASFQLNWEVVGNGGNTMQSSSFVLHSTTGQSAVNNMNSSSYELGNGYWQELFDGIYELFLPLIKKD